jgi:hypothetical protein
VTLHSAKAFVYFNANAPSTWLAHKNIAAVNSLGAGTFSVQTSNGLYSNNYGTWIVNVARPEGANGPEINVAPNLDRSTGTAVEAAPILSSGSLLVKFYCFEENTASGETPKYVYVVFY